MTGWTYLIASIVFEVIGTYAVKLSDGMTRLWPSVLVAISFAISFWLFALAVRTIALGVAYAVWSGTATAAITIIGVVYFKDSLTVIKIVSIALIVTGIIGLNISGNRA